MSRTFKSIFSVAAIMIAVSSSSVATEVEDPSVASVAEQASAPDASSHLVKLFRTVDKDKVEVVSIDDDLDVPSHFKDVIKDVYRRAQKDLPEVVGRQFTRIDLVAVPHPEIDLPDNPRFAFIKKDIPATVLIPLVGRTVERQITAYAALEVEVTLSSGETKRVRGLGESTEKFSRGFGLFSRSNKAEAKTTGDAVTMAYGNLISGLQAASRDWVDSSSARQSDSTGKAGGLPLWIN
ncbi:hypothetical protein [Propionivibrio limicola]|uniref:hypothetical protein n=1 Tax=Propionivibrio limicola TaxID=167645 RepID=UPI0012916766|nr:hypothetical protein [Propionivibrio limicola]